jgi:hypothetical protein
VSYSNTVLIFIVNPTTTEGISLNSNRGKNFWMAFGRNYTNSYSGVTLQLKIAATQTTNVTLSFQDDPSVNQTYTIAGGTVGTIDLTNDQKNACYNYYSTPTITDKSLHITSTDSIVVYAINLYMATTDATAIYPVGSLGSDYFHMGYPPISFDLSSLDGFVIVATAPGTTNIYENTLGGTLLATLSEGQVYNHYGANNSTDLSGMHIVADKPVAYYMNHTIAFVPAGGTWYAGDILWEQLFSTDRWGTHFFVPQTEQEKVRIRIMARESGTNLTIPGLVAMPVGAVASDLYNQTGLMGPIEVEPNNSVITGSQPSITGLSAGQFVEIDMGAATHGCYIASNKPVMVCSYMVCTNYTTYGGNWGDPAMGWIPPIEQKTRAVVVSRFAASNSNVDKHRALIVTATSGKASTTVAVGGGAAATISGVTWYDNIDAGLSYCSYTLPDDNYYTFDNSNGLVVGGYGFGSYESYYYLGGASARVLTAPLLINGNYSDEIMGDTYGSCTPITFTCAATTTPTSITWKVNGVVQPSYSNLTTWSATLPVSDYMIEMEAVIGTDTFTQITWFRVRSCP